MCLGAGVSGCVGGCVTGWYVSSGVGGCVIYEYMYQWWIQVGFRGFH